MDLNDYLRLEVGADSANLVPNPSGRDGAWFYSTPVSNTILTSDGSDLQFKTTVSQAAYFTTLPIRVAAGKYVSSRIDIVSITASHNVKVRYEWLDSSKALLSTSTQSAGISTGTGFGLTVQAPAGTAYVRMRFDFYNGTSNPSANATVDFKNVMLTANATGTASTIRTNLLMNPSFETNTTSWSGVRGTISRFTGGAASGAGTACARVLKSSVTANYMGIASDGGDIGTPVTGGKDYSAQALFFPTTTGRRAWIRIYWYDNLGQLITYSTGQGTSDLTANAWTKFTFTMTAPTNAVAASVDLYLYSPSGNIPTNEAGYFDAVMLEQASAATAYFDGSFTATSQWTYSWLGTAHASQSRATSTSTYFDYVDPYIWTNVLGPSSEIKTDSAGLDAGTATVRILDATLDPSTATTLAPSSPVRLRALTSTGWTSLYEGKVDDLNVSYRRDENKHSKLVIITDIELTAVNNVQQLANVKTLDSKGRSIGVALTDLPAILENAGVPWNINGSGSQVATYTVLSTSDSASVLDEISIARDTALGYAWVNRFNVLNAVDSAHASTSVLATFGDSAEPSYSDIDVQYGVTDLINSVTIQWLSKGADGSTTAIPYGPYVDQASIDEYGTFSAEYVYQGSTDTGIASYANSILTAMAQPRKRVRSLSFPVRTVSDIDLAAKMDLYGLVHVNYSTLINADYRITSVSHNIVAQADRHVWYVTLGFDTQSGVASPRVESSTVATSSTAGEVMMYAGSSIPSGWLLCDGSAVSRSTYKDLFNAISTTYGTGDGSTTFNLPDFRSRFPIGAGTFAALGDGDANAESARTPQHSHGAGTLVNSSFDHTQATNTTASGTANRLTSPVTHNHTISGSTGTTGKNAIPYQSVNFIIRYA